MVRNTKIYFDYAAATPLSPQVKKAMEPYQTSRFYNPSAQYLAAKEVHQDVEKARADIASILGARPQEIIFTAGGTEANNLAVHGVLSAFRDGSCVVSAIEHDAIREPARRHKHVIVPVKADGRVDVDKIESAIDGKTVLVSVMYANNEIGTVQPIAELSKCIRAIRELRAKKTSSLPIYLHTDACQAGNYLPLLVNTLGVDLMTLNGGKIYGPKQSGILYIRTGTVLESLIDGGGQERGLRSGTENVAGAIGFAAALTHAQSIRVRETARLKTLQSEFIKQLSSKLPEALINGSISYRLPNNLHITIPGSDNERLMMELDEAGFMVAAGSACSASSDEPSHVLKAIGLSDKEARSSLRITMGRHTRAEDVSALCSELIKLSR